MKARFIVTLLASLVPFAATALADGFVCETVDGELTLSAYNHTDPTVGTRSGAVLVLSDPDVGHGRRTVARFTAWDGTLANLGAVYTGTVSPTVAGTSRGGEYLLGTRLGQVAKVRVAIDFSYGNPIGDGEQTTGRITLLKKSGPEIARDMTCTRYLKGG